MNGPVRAAAKTLGHREVPGRRREIGGDVPKMDQAALWDWLGELGRDQRRAVREAAFVAEAALMEVAAKRRRRRCGRDAGRHVEILKGFLQ